MADEVHGPGSSSQRPPPAGPESSGAVSPPLGPSVTSTQGWGNQEGGNRILPPPPPPGAFVPSPLVAPRAQWQRGRPVPLRPMRVGETLDAAINLYRHHWKTFMAIAAYITVPFVFLQQLATAAFVGGDIFARPNVAISTARSETLLAVGLAFAAIDFLLVRPFLTAAIVRAVGAAYLGEIPTVGRVYDFALRRLGSIVWVVLLGVLGFVAVFVAASGFAFLFVSIGVAPFAIVVGIGAGVFAIVLYVRWMFGAAVVVIETERGSRALARSWRLSSRAFWRIVGTTMLAGLLVAVVGGVFTYVPSLLSTQLGSAGWVLRAAGSAVASVITTPFVTMITVLLYFDQRIRKEGMDLAIMSGELQAPPRT